MQRDITCKECRIDEPRTMDEDIEITEEDTEGDPEVADENNPEEPATDCIEVAGEDGDDDTEPAKEDTPEETSPDDAIEVAGEDREGGNDVAEDIENTLEESTDANTLDGGTEIAEENGGEDVEVNVEENTEDTPDSDTGVTGENKDGDIEEASENTEEGDPSEAIEKREKTTVESSPNDNIEVTEENTQENTEEKYIEVNLTETDGGGDIEVAEDNAPEPTPDLDIEVTGGNTAVDIEMTAFDTSEEAAGERGHFLEESPKPSDSESSSSSSSEESDDEKDKGISLEMRLEKQKKKKRKKEKRHIKETIQFQDLNVDASGSPIGDLPPPPIVDGVPQFYGYGNIGITASTLPPPPLPPTPPPEDQVPFEYTDIAQLNEDECRAALLQHVSEHCCYGKKPVQNMKVTSHVGITALHLVLETFTESRSTKFKRKPYKGESVTGPKSGPPPQPWEIPCQADTTFKEDKKKLEIPHTSIVKKCYECHGKGRRKCKGECRGKGQITCSSCEGSGTSETIDEEGNAAEGTCLSCQGDGKVRCITCGGDGKITCNKCQGNKKLRHFVQMSVKFNTHKDEFTKEASDMPDDLVKGVSGKIIFDVSQPLINPVITYPVVEINENSVKMVDAHRTKWRDERILLQRHILRGVPVTEVHYTWDDVSTRYWVYGDERKVYAPDYPHRCCWGCAIV